MKPLFTIHEGEFLVGDYITRNLKKYEVWIPAKDKGVDLLVTTWRKPRRAVGIQVKHSRSYKDRYDMGDDFLARGWHTLKPDKVRDSKAEVWIFTILTLRHEMYYTVIPLKELKKRIPKNNSKTWTLYLTVLTGGRCYDTRTMPKPEGHDLLNNPPKNRTLDYSKFQSNWKVLDTIGK